MIELWDFEGGGWRVWLCKNIQLVRMEKKEEWKKAKKVQNKIFIIKKLLW